MMENDQNRQQKSDGIQVIVLIAPDQILDGIPQIQHSVRKNAGDAQEKRLVVSQGTCDEATSRRKDIKQTH